MIIVTKQIKNKKQKIKNNIIFYRLKTSLFSKDLYNKQSIIFKITMTAILLAIAISLSLIEIFDIPTPWGFMFGVRFFDTLILIYSICIIGLWFSLLEGIILPWIHNLIDSHHIWIEMLFFMISNIIVIFIYWIIYYIFFNAYFKYKIKEDIKNHDIHEYHLVKKNHNYHYKISNINIFNKIFAFIIIIPLCALTETFNMLIIAKILLFSTKKIKYNDNFIYNCINNHINCNNLNFIFLSWKNIIIFCIIFFIIFIIKYILNSTLFILLERKTRILIDRFGIYS